MAGRGPAVPPLLSPPAGRGWIEISLMRRGGTGKLTSPSAGRAWIEIAFPQIIWLNEDKSPSAGRAWIEMTPGVLPCHRGEVALRGEGGE